MLVRNAHCQRPLSRHVARTRRSSLQGESQATIVIAACVPAHSIPRICQPRTHHTATGVFESVYSEVRGGVWTWMFWQPSVAFLQCVLHWASKELGDLTSSGIVLHRWRGKKTPSSLGDAHGLGEWVEEGGPPPYGRRPPPPHSPNTQTLRIDVSRGPGAREGAPPMFSVRR